MNQGSDTIKTIEDFRDLCINFATGVHTDYEVYESARNDVLAIPSIKAVVPDWIIKYRYGSSFWQAMKSLSPHYAPRRTFLQESFGDFIDAVKEDKAHPVSVSIAEAMRSIKQHRLVELWAKISDRKKTDPEGVITAARTLVETVLKYILDSEGVAYTENDDLPGLYNKVAKILNLSPGGHEEQLFKQITSGVISVVTGFGRMRNKYGDAHGQGVQSYKAEPRHAELAVNLSGALTAFLIETYSEWKKTKQTEQKIEDLEHNDKEKENQ